MRPASPVAMGPRESRTSGERAPRLATERLFGALVQPAAAVFTAVVRLPVRAVARLPEHREPHRADEEKFGDDDGQLATAGEAVEEGLHLVRQRGEVSGCDAGR